MHSQSFHSLLQVKGVFENFHFLFTYPKLMVFVYLFFNKNVLLVESPYGGTLGVLLIAKVLVPGP